MTDYPSSDLNGQAGELEPVISPVILVPKKNIILDATMLSTLMSCARYYDFRHNHDLIQAGGKSNSLEVGSIIHKALEVYYKHLINGFAKPIAIGQAISAAQLYITGCPHCSNPENIKPECKHQPLEYPGVQNTPQYNDRYIVGWEFALQTCEQYFDFYKSDSWTPLFVETVKGEVLYEDDEIRVLWKAKMDLGVDTNQGIYPVDHKTFKQNRQKSTLNNQFIGQALIMKTRNVIINKIGLQTSKELKDRFTREVISFSADRLLEWQSEILPYHAYKLIQYQETGYWPPDYTHCDTMYGPCAFKQVCEADRNMRNEVISMNFIKGPKWDVFNPED